MPSQSVQNEERGEEREPRRGAPATPERRRPSRPSRASTREPSPAIVERIVEEPGERKAAPGASGGKGKAPSPKAEEPPESAKKFSREELENELKELSKTLKARFYDKDFARIKELSVREVIKSIEEVDGIHAIVFDGIVTQRLVDLAENKGVAILVGGKMGNVSKKPTKLELVIPSSKR